MEQNNPYVLHKEEFDLINKFIEDRCKELGAEDYYTRLETIETSEGSYSYFLDKNQYIITLDFNLLQQIN